MYLKIDDYIYKKIKEYTMTDYERIGDYLPQDSIIPIFEDLISEIEKRDIEKEEREEFIKDNYKQITPEEMYG